MEYIFPKIAKFQFSLKFILLAGFLIFSTLFYAQIEGTVKGRITDVEIGSPLFAANICILKGEQQFSCVISDEQGYFIIEKIPVGEYSLVVSVLGYKPYVMKILKVTSGKQIDLPIALEESAFEIEAFEVKSLKREEVNNEFSTISSRTFAIEETDRYAGSRGDPARMASNFPGIRGSDDSRNDIVIRGNSPLGLLWRIDGITVPNPSHFALFGTTGGPIGILNNKTLANSDFMTAAFPAEYGNALAGVFDLKLRNGNAKKHEFTGQFGVMGLEALAEGPINKEKHSSYLVSYRYSTLALFTAVGLKIGVSSNPTYQDLTFKLNFPTKKGYFSVFSVAGISDIKLLDADRDSSDFSFGDLGRDVYFGSRLAIMGFNYHHFINEKTSLKFSYSPSYSSSYSRHDLRRDTADFSKVINPLPFLRNKMIEIDQTAQAILNKKIGKKHTLKTGLVAKNIAINFSDSVYRKSTESLQERITTVDRNDLFLVQAYAQWKYKISKRWTANGGANYLLFTYNNSQAVEPRAGLRFNINDNSSLSAGYGVHHQLQPIYTYFLKVTDKNGVKGPFNQNMDFTRSTHYVLGYENYFTEFLRFKLEGYYQYLDKIPVQSEASSSFSMINEGRDMNFIELPGKLVNEGTAENYGVEMTIEKFFNKKYFFLITGSLYESKYKGSDGIERNTAFNANYLLNLLGAKSFVTSKEKKNYLTIGGKYTLGGGNRYTPFDMVNSDYFNTAYLTDQAYSQQSKEYQRFDVRISHTANRKKSSHELALDLINVLNIQNVLTRIYNPITKEAYEEPQLGFLPILYYKIQF